VNFQQETDADARFAILMKASTQRATLIGQRVAVDRDLLELLQISNLSVIYCKFWHITQYSVPKRKTS